MDYRATLMSTLTMETKMRLNLKTTSLLLAAILIVAGCGGSSNGKNAKDDTSSMSRTAESGEPDGSPDRPYELTVNDETSKVTLKTPSSPDKESPEWIYARVTNNENLKVAIDSETEPGTSENLRAIWVACQPTARVVQSSVDGRPTCDENPMDADERGYMEAYKDSSSEDGASFELEAGQSADVILAVVPSCDTCEPGPSDPNSFVVRFISN